jgi:hypothetical protein
MILALCIAEEERKPKAMYKQHAKGESKEREMKQRNTLETLK